LKRVEDGRADACIVRGDAVEVRGVNVAGIPHPDFLSDVILDEADRFHEVGIAGNDDGAIIVVGMSVK
jgi:hypothetical protein